MKPPDVPVFVGGRNPAGSLVDVLDLDGYEVRTARRPLECTP